MFFNVCPFRSRFSPTDFLSQKSEPSALLIEDNWDDFGFQTWFHLKVLDERREIHDLGGVKIGKFGQTSGRTNIPKHFDLLDDSFFSLGQDSKYYEELAKFSLQLKEKITKGLHDIISDQNLLPRALNERVTKVSFLRFVSVISIQEQFQRILNGGEKLSTYNFSYILCSGESNASTQDLELSFEVIPESFPPTNIHILIGRNGVGKTRLLNTMTKTLLGEIPTSPKHSRFVSQPNYTFNSKLFANLVSVAFSAFDDFMPRDEEQDKTRKLKYSYVGLKYLDESDNILTMSPEMLIKCFLKSVRSVKAQQRIDLWEKSLEILESDPIFKSIDIKDIANQYSSDSSSIETIFKKLSSGHKIVVLTITQLVENLEEKSLVLLDEPEAHLHPPLLSAFIRSLSELLIRKNGVAIIATHSPVILQEVPKNCVWKISRSIAESKVERPSIETFGENIGVLTREVFGLEVTQAGFHQMLKSAAERGLDFDATLDVFNNQLGNEARAILRALIFKRDN